MTEKKEERKPRHRKPYSKPRIVAQGSVEQITLDKTNLGFEDALVFSETTPLSLS